ncbi:MFS transporter [Bradyrhizobium elkanii]
MATFGPTLRPTPGLDANQLTPSEHQLQMRRAVIASTIGTAIEWYDFFLYSTVTGLVFAKLFFPNSDPWVGTLEAFAIYAVGFVARPIGAAIFGHYGDRIGRKSTLIATLLLMGLATAAVALVPTYSSIGIWGAVILTVLRFIQGVGVGGEWGGSVLMSMEWARNDRSRGLIASWPQFGVPCGLFLANLAVLAFSQMSGDQFLAWGWRVPFALSIVLVGVGLYIRLGILETPVFTRLLAERQLDRTPMLTVIKDHPKEILLSAFARMSEQAPFYIFTAFVFSYGTGTLHVSRDFLLTAVLAASVLSFVSIPVFGHLSDQIGRKNMYMIGALVTGIFGFIYFAMLNTGSRVDHLPRDHSLAHSARHAVRAAGRADRRKLYRALALQRRLARLSARVRHRRRSGAADRGVAVRHLSFVDRDRGLHRALRRHHAGRDRADDRLHRQGHQCGRRA